MPTTIKLKNSVTTTSAPSSLAQGEVAINVTDKKVWVGNAATTPVQLLGDGGSGSFTSIAFGAGTVSAPSITFTGDTNTGIYSPAADTIAFTEGGVESMRIDSAGNVGIGNNNPTAKLVVGQATAGATAVRFNGVAATYNFDFNGGGDSYFDQNTIYFRKFNATACGQLETGTNTALTLTSTSGIAALTLNTQSANTSFIVYQSAGVENAATTSSNSNLMFHTGSARAERMRIDSSGNVGIGTTSPAQRLDATVSSATEGSGLAVTNSLIDGYGSGISFYSTASDSTKILAGRVGMRGTGSWANTANASSAMAFSTVSAGTLSERMRISSTGQVGINGAPSNTLQVSEPSALDANFYLTATAASRAAVMTMNSTIAGYDWLYSQTNGVKNWGIGGGTTSATLTFGTGSSVTERMRITAAGEVLVATTTALNDTNAAIQIAAGASASRYFSAGKGTGYGALFGYENGSAFGTGVMIRSVQTGDPIMFLTNNTNERMRIDSSGNLLVGKTAADLTTAGTALIPAYGGANTPGFGLAGASSTNSQLGYHQYSTTASAFRFYVGYGGTIFATSTSISGISDKSLKENIVDIEPSLEKVMALKPRRFDWKPEMQIQEKQIQGFVAQELEEVLPDLVYDYQYNQNEVKKSIKMGDMIPTLVKAIQELKAELDSVKAELQTLKGA